MTNQFMQDGLTYMVNKAYQRGLKHSIMLLLGVSVVVCFLSFQAGRAFEYVQSVKYAAEQMQDLPVVKGAK